MRIADLGLFYDSIGLIAVLFDLLSFKNCNCSSPDLFDLQFFFTKDLGQSILIYLKDFLSPNKSKHLSFRTGYSFQKRFEKKERRVFKKIGTLLAKT